MDIALKINSHIIILLLGLLCLCPMYEEVSMQDSVVQLVLLQMLYFLVV